VRSKFCSVWLTKAHGDGNQSRKPRRQGSGSSLPQLAKLSEHRVSLGAAGVPLCCEANLRTIGSSSYNFSRQDRGYEAQPGELHSCRGRKALTRRGAQFGALSMQEVLARRRCAGWCGKRMQVGGGGGEGGGGSRR
jgi:hypothetical protein